ncbi:hypothetical protein DERP_004764 [Dermatophagoides pteronyssinus]|uniref:Uncharacterized protein n=1 Tax=Dermatophagoides pteronyssinus TaxID=6956 RepID=A0ABQ8JPP9_DERPT|nr:hypothetical protein DERP_004764 [Dermatophagoides pteronyssinus]
MTHALNITSLACLNCGWLGIGLDRRYNLSKAESIESAATSYTNKSFVINNNRSGVFPTVNKFNLLPLLSRKLSQICCSQG